MDKHNAKYSDLILMQYSDGELDKSLCSDLEKELENNQKLQERLAVFTLTRKALINTKIKLPKHIESLIDEKDGKINDEKIIKFSGSRNNKFSSLLTNYPISSVAASIMFGLFVGSQGATSLQNSPYEKYFSEGPIQEYHSASESTKKILSLSGIQTLKHDKPNYIAINIIKTLGQNPNISKIQLDNGIVATITTSFVNSSAQRCKLIEASSLYFIACTDALGKWSIQQNKQ